MKEYWENKTEQKKSQEKIVNKQYKDSEETTNRNVG